MTVAETEYQLAHDPEITLLDRRVLDVLKHFADREGYVHMTVAEIAGDLGSSIPKTSQALTKLTRKSLIMKERNGLYLVLNRTVISEAEAARRKKALAESRRQRTAAAASVSLRAVG